MGSRCGETGFDPGGQFGLDRLSRFCSFGGGNRIARMIADAEPFALTGIVVTEVLQGLRREVSRIEHYLSQWDMLEPVGYKTYREAAVIFRNARAKGVAVTTVDALIAAIALEHGATLFTLDQDFTRIAGIVRLPLYSF